MFDRSARHDLLRVRPDTLFGPIAGTGRGLASPGPGAHDPLRPRRAKPSFAGFNSSAKSGRGGVDRPGALGQGLASSIIGHSAIAVKTKSAVPRPFDTTRPRTTGAHFERHIDVPGPGAYEVMAPDFVRPTTAKVGAVAAPPQAPAQMHPALQAVRQLQTHKNPPSVPSRLDYGYEVVDGRRLVPQAPPPEIAPRASPPTSTTYAPSDRLTRPHSAAATARYANDRTARVGLASFADASVPGPGAYALPVGAAAGALRPSRGVREPPCLLPTSPLPARSAAAPRPSDKLLSAVFASRTR